MRILKAFKKICKKKAPEETKDNHLVIMEGVQGIKNGKIIKK